MTKEIVELSIEECELVAGGGAESPRSGHIAGGG
jgi:hypothetical protein